jgi:hypothetical protein
MRTKSRLKATRNLLHEWDPSFPRCIWPCKQTKKVPQDQEQIKELMHASIQVQCAHFSGAESICIMLMEETKKEVNH